MKTKNVVIDAAASTATLLAMGFVVSPLSFLAVPAKYLLAARVGAGLSAVTMQVVNSKFQIQELEKELLERMRGVR